MTFAVLQSNLVPFVVKQYLKRLHPDRKIYLVPINATGENIAQAHRDVVPTYYRTPTTLIVAA